MTNAELIAELRGHILSVPLTLLHDAADALEAAEKRIDELQKLVDINEGEWISNYDGFEWNVRCSVCGEEALIKEGGSHDHAYSHYCPNCGARMKGEQE